VQDIMRALTKVSLHLSAKRADVVEKAAVLATPIGEHISNIFSKEDHLASLKDDCLNITGLQDSISLYNKFKEYELAQEKVKTCVEQVGLLKAKYVDVLPNLADATKDMATDQDPQDLGMIGRVVGNLTGLQALHRDLKVGETRSQLATRCFKGLSKKKLMSIDPKLSLTLNGFLGSAGSASAGSGNPPQPATEQ
jgi:hypothetical protein